MCKTFSDVEKDKYIENCGSKCPHCGDSDIELISYDFGGCTCYTLMYCLSCEKKWNEEYSLISISK